MDVYTLDNLLRRKEVIDRFESLIWTERFTDVGEFELQLRSTVEARSLLTIGTYLAIPSSTRVMRIDTTDDTIDSEGRSIFKVTGKSIENILNDRVARINLDNLTTTPQWIVSGSPANIMRQVFKNVCVDGLLDVNDKIPFYVDGNIYPTDTIPEDTDSITIPIDPNTLFNVIKSFADTYQIGFRLIRNGDNSQLMFNVYTGNDHTSAQFDISAPVVTFSKDLGNLRNVTELTTTATLKNVAIVVAANGTRVVYAPNFDATNTIGFDRRALIVKSDNALAAGTTLNNALDNEGLVALAKQRNTVAFDGEIPQFGGYTYGKDYELGDLVEMRNSDGLVNYMRVTEQIFVSDAEGDRSYPTLVVYMIITPDSWFALSSRLVWSDAIGTWVDELN